MRKFWTEAEDDRLRREYPDTRTSELARRMDRSLRGVYLRASKLWLGKSPQYLRAYVHTLRGQEGKQFRFKPGLVPWNKGLKGFDPGGRSREGQFEKGHPPQNGLPLGCFRFNSDGYLQKKQRDNGRSTDWVGVQALIWQRKNGPIPRGHIVVFRDAHKRYYDLPHLELISRAQNMRRNSIHNYPSELKHVMRLNQRLRRAIKERTA